MAIGFWEVVGIEDLVEDIERRTGCGVRFCSDEECRDWALRRFSISGNGEYS